MSWSINTFVNLSVWFNGDNETLITKVKIILFTTTYISAV